METITIKKSDLQKFGEDLMKKIDEYLHDEYTLTFPEMKIEQEKFDKYLNKVPKFKYLSFELEKYITEDSDILKDSDIVKDTDMVIDKRTLKERYKDEELDIQQIYDIIDRVKLDFELDEDLYCEKKAFVYLYNVFDHYFTYLLKH